MKRRLGLDCGRTVISGSGEGTVVRRRGMALERVMDQVRGLDREDADVDERKRESQEAGMSAPHPGQCSAFGSGGPQAA
jgi:hypothetical protein